MKTYDPECIMRQIKKSLIKNIFRATFNDFFSDMKNTEEIESSINNIEVFYERIIKVVNWKFSFT